VVSLPIGARPGDSPQHSSGTQFGISLASVEQSLWSALVTLENRVLTSAMSAHSKQRTRHESPKGKYCGSKAIQKPSYCMAD